MGGFSRKRLLRPLSPDEQFSGLLCLSIGVASFACIVYRIWL